MAVKRVSGASRVIGPGVQHPVPIALSAAAYPGCWVFGSDGEMYRSNGSVWSSVVANTYQIIRNGQTRTVGAGGDFATLRLALEHYAALTPVSGDVTVNLNILAGHVITQPANIRAADLGYINIVSQDATVNVDVTGWTPDSNGRAPMIRVTNGTAPRVITKFVATGTRPAATVLIGMYLVTSVWDNGLGVPDLYGFQNFDVGLLALTSNAVCGNNAFDDNLVYGVWASTSQLYLGGVTARRCGTHGLLLSEASTALLAGDSSSYRRTNGVDTSDDIAINGGSIAAIEGNVLGGTIVPVNRWSFRGVITRSTVPFNPSGIVTPASYTVGTLPSATTYANSIIHVSNGNSGSPCLAVADGGVWRRIALGTAVST